MKRTLLAAVCGLALYPTLALAQPEDPACPGAPPEICDPDVTVTEVPGVQVTRVWTAVDDAVAATVIGRETIELRQASEPADLLQLVPGLAVTRTGAFGGLTAIRQRGASSDKTLVLIDGIPLNDPSQPAGGYDLSSLDLVDVDRIEVLSGPQGSLWGSDAIGGVVNVVTRPMDGWRLGLEGGSYNYLRGEGALGWSDYHRGRVSLAVAGWRADGPSQADERDGNGENDQAWGYTAVAGGDLRITSGISLFGRGRYVRSRTDTDGFPAPNFTLADTQEYAQSEAWLADVGVSLQGAWGVRHVMRFGYYDLDRGNLGGDFPSTFTARRQLWRYEASRGGYGDRIAVQGGVELEDNRASLSDGAQRSTATLSTFLVVRATPVPRLTLTGSVRYDDPSDVSGRATGRLSAVFRATETLSFVAAWGQGFKTPTISQLACDFCFPPGPSVSLRPERAQGYEAGLRWRSRRLEADLTLYRLEVEDQIDFTVVFPFVYRNLEETRTNGLEARAALDLADAWRLDGAYAWTDAVDVAADTQLLRIPEHAGHVSLTWRGERAAAVLTVRAQSDQADAGGRRDGFVVADLAGQYDLTERVQLTARIENLTDEHYQQALGYGEPGLSAYVGVRVRGN